MQTRKKAKKRKICSSQKVFFEFGLLVRRDVFFCFFCHVVLAQNERDSLNLSLLPFPKSLNLLPPKQEVPNSRLRNLSFYTLFMFSSQHESVLLFHGKIIVNPFRDRLWFSFERKRRLEMLDGDLGFRFIPLMVLIYLRLSIPKVVKETSSHSQS